MSEQSVALVTGAAGGIGRATCRALAEDGVLVIGTDHAAALESARVALPDIDWRPLDVTEPAQWQALVAAIGAEHGRLDILVNAAGVAPVGPMFDITLAEWRRCQAINVDGVFLGIQAAATLMGASGARRKGGAAVINLASAGGNVGSPFLLAYCTAKGAVRNLTKAAALEFSALGLPIRVNSVHPGGVRTDMMRGISADFAGLAGLTEAEADKAYVAAHPIGRLCEPEEVADGIAYLASPKASYMHGCEFVIDGGFLAR